MAKSLAPLAALVKGRSDWGGRVGALRAGQNLGPAEAKVVVITRASAGTAGTDRS
ncbi:MAG: hypothetical protein HUU21_20450 [Polyangiaceae bacterium]|nr:hypothetical protein [Polyangiaceae bacterium]NUQ75918.1 hypothetical protein [Polyangiaceae bacterium]